jgi:hypothetical protein
VPVPPEEIIAAALAVGGANKYAPPSKGGRPRKHASDTARKRAWKQKATKRVTKPAGGDEMGDETQVHGRLVRDETRDETPDLHRALLVAANGNADERASIEPIRALEADVLPTVARTVPELPRPLKRWDAPWLEPPSASPNRLPLIDGQLADRWFAGPSSDR